MIKKNQKRFNALHVLMDVIIIVIAYLRAWTIKFKTNLLNENIGHLGIKTYLIGMVILVVLFLILYAVSGVYAPRRMYGKWYEVLIVLRADCFGVVLFVTGLYLVHEDNFSRMMLIIFFVLDMMLEILARVLLRSMLRSIRKKGYNQKHIVLVGYSRAAKSYIDRIRQYPQWGYNIVGFLDDNTKRDTSYRGVQMVGTLDEISSVIEKNDLDEIVLTLGLDEYGKLERLVEICERYGIHTKFIPDYNNVFQSRPYMEDILGLPIIHVRRTPLSNRGNAALKRTGDVVLGTLMLLLLSPLMGIIAIGIKVSSPGPVIFKQTRVGYHNKEFLMYKFRTMRYEGKESEGTGATRWTKRGDERVTGFGKFLRKTSLDELPQLVNVLRGEMSLIGPRPERPYYVDIFKDKIPRYMVKHQVRPGMTGWAQVNGYRGNTSIKKRVEYDLYYIENWTVWFDLKILLHTVLHGFINRNAY